MNELTEESFHLHVPSHHVTRGLLGKVVSGDTKRRTQNSKVTTDGAAKFAKNRLIQRKFETSTRGHI